MAPTYNQHVLLRCEEWSVEKRSFLSATLY